MDFGEALKELRAGKKLTRDGWKHCCDLWIKLQVPDAYSKMNLTYIYIHLTRGDRVPWSPTYTDILAEDWMVVE